MEVVIDNNLTLKLTLDELENINFLQMHCSKYMVQIFEAIFEDINNYSSGSSRNRRANICYDIYKNFTSVQKKYHYVSAFHIKDRYIKNTEEEKVSYKKESYEKKELSCYYSETDKREFYYPERFNNITGLYFLGMVNTNPITNETFYWVKIGYAKNILSRMRNYNTHCPMLWHIDYTDNENEFYYHAQLTHYAINRCNHNDEWFMVDKITYLQMCEKGFEFFS